MCVCHTAHKNPRQHAVASQPYRWAARKLSIPHPPGPQGSMDSASPSAKGSGDIRSNIDADLQVAAAAAACSFCSGLAHVHVALALPGTIAGRGQPCRRQLFHLQERRVQHDGWVGPVGTSYTSRRLSPHEESGDMQTLAIRRRHAPATSFYADAHSIIRSSSSQCSQDSRVNAPGPASAVQDRQQPPTSIGPCCAPFPAPNFTRPSAAPPHPLPPLFLGD